MDDNKEAERISKYAILAVVMSAIVGFFGGISYGYNEGWSKAREEYKNECLCGSTQSCAFGPGIVGEQTCRTTGSFTNKWNRCEPKD